MAGHSRRCADLAADAVAGLGGTDDEVAAARRAALLHEFGSTAVPNSILDKPTPLTRAEFDRIQHHPMFTDQMLSRAPALAALTPIAGAHHEKADGTGYHKGLRGEGTARAARVLAAVDIYVGLTAERADRPAFSAEHAASELRELAGRGLLDREATDAVLAAAGHPETAKGRRAPLPAGLTPREAEVLRLAALGLTTRQIADRLYISPKTADHHIQHAYGKIGVSTRAAAALWAMHNDLVR
jgi:HD-GYP domain-containing protein (c-di-GMP phosphodiesterase class II)